MASVLIIFYDLQEKQDIEESREDLRECLSDFKLHYFCPTKVYICHFYISIFLLLLVPKSSIDMGKLESLYPGWKLAADVKSVHKRRVGKTNYDVI